MQTVRPGGAADRAGVREHDIIVKVNGQRVTEASHSEVVELIQGRTSFLFLTSNFESYCTPPETCVQTNKKKIRKFKRCESYSHGHQGRINHKAD